MGRQEPLTETSYLILVALSEPRHGYGIMQVVKLASHGQVVLGPGTLYGALTKMLDQGWIARAGEGDEGGERRKMYVLTDKGREVVEKETQRLNNLAMMGRFLLAGAGGWR
jgi:DNA-binding PadR family transcriptional regulator